MGLLVFLIIVLAIPLTVNIAQKQQELRQRAYEAPSCTPGEGLTCDTGEKRDDCSGGLSRTCSCGEGFTGTEVFEKQSDGQCYSSGKCYATCIGRVTPPTTPTCAQNGNTCVASPDRCDGIGVPGDGICPPGGPSICCKPTPTTPSSSNPTNGLPCGTQGGKCLSGACVIGDSLDADSNAIQTCQGGKTQASGTNCGSVAGQVCYQSLDACVSDIGSARCKLVTSASCTNGYSCFDTTGSGTCSSGPSSDWKYTCGCTSSEDSVLGGGHTALCTKNPQQTDGNYCWSNALHPGSGCTTPTGGTPASSGTSVPSTDTCTPNQGLCQFKAIQDCNAANAPKQCATATNLNCPNNNPCMKVFPSTAAVPPSQIECAAINENLSGACQVAQNTCSNSSTGTRTVVKDSGTAGCKSVTVPGQPCKKPDSVINNCTPGNACPTGGTGACVAKPPATGGTQFAFTVGLDGLGDVGDFRTNQQTSSAANSNPVHKTRTFYFQVFDAALTTEKANGSTQIVYDSATKRFKGPASLGQTLPAGTYSMKVRAVGYLGKVIRNISIGTDPAQVSAKLYAGYINEVNQKFAITPEDYNIFLSCSIFSTDNHTLCSQNSQWIVNSDLNDDGRVDQFDYNLLLREFPAPANKDQD